MSVVYRKTDKGQTEIGTRACGLSLRLRQALILVDGRKTASDIDKLILADQACALEALLADGFIEVTGTVVDLPLDLPLDLAAAEALPAVSVDVLKRQAARCLIDQLGRHVEPLAVKLEGAKSAADAQTLLAHAVKALRSIGRNALADEFTVRFLTPLQDCATRPRVGGDTGASPALQPVGTTVAGAGSPPHEARP